MERDNMDESQCRGKLDCDRWVVSQASYSAPQTWSATERWGRVLQNASLLLLLFIYFVIIIIIVVLYIHSPIRIHGLMLK
jgi:hypothetical protein